MGENVTLKRVSAISEPTSAVLSEGIRIPEDALALTTKSITVSEIGRSVPFTSFAEDLSELDIEGTVQGELKRQMKLVLDSMAATGFKTRRSSTSRPACLATTSPRTAPPALQALWRT
jgi:hypothetical protein